MGHQLFLLGNILTNAVTMKLGPFFLPLTKYNTFTNSVNIEPVATPRTIACISWPYFYCTSFLLKPSHPHVYVTRVAVSLSTLAKCDCDCIILVTDYVGIIGCILLVPGLCWVLPSNTVSLLTGSLWHHQYK